MHDHHARLYIAPSLMAVAEGELAQSPDVQHLSVEQFGIDDARALGEMATKKPVAADTLTCVVFAGTMTSEAQNALLKLFEDPPPTTRFVLVVPSEHQLLPTLRSRLFLVAENQIEVAESPEFVAFLKASYAERLDQIAVYQKSKEADWLKAILAGVTHYKNTNRLSLAEAKSIELFASRINTRGSSAKLLLEELALSLS